MNYALAGEVIEWLQEPSGECTREKLFKVLNACRERFYLMYETVPLFDLTMCFEVQNFCADCSRCHETYRGVTLSRDFQNVEAMWCDDVPVQLFTSWREWQHGLAPYRSCNLAKYDMPQSYASERDPLVHQPARLTVSAFNAVDFGKVVTLRYVDFSGVSRVEVLTLKENGVTTEYPARGLAQGAGFTKPRTVGGVALATDAGRFLSVYAPDETVPSYRRIKITGLPDRCAQVMIRGARKYFPVFREEDVVETNNRVAFEEMARFLRLNSKVSKSGDDIRTMTVHAGQAAAALKGEKSREMGKSVRQDLQILSPRIGPKRIGGSGW